MNVSELLKFVDESMFEKTGKHLNDMQRQVIEGALNHQKYVDIADVFDRSEGHVRDTGYELLRMLSDIFEEPVSKANLKSVLERKRNINFNIGDGSVGNNIGDGVQVIGCLNYKSGQSMPPSDKVQSEETDTRQKNQQAKINKLREVGLNDDEIAELLEVHLELVQSAKLEV